MEKQLLLLLEEFLKAVIELVEEKRYDKRQSSDILGTVAGRSVDEDVEIKIDRECEDLFKKHFRKFCREHHIAVQVYSEHGTYKLGRGKVVYLCFIDPFDGSGLFQRGLPAEWYSVLSICTPDGRPVVGGTVDILRRELFLADVPNEQVELCDLRRGTREMVTPSSRTAVDNETILAAYLIDPSYQEEWTDRMRPFFASSPRQSRNSFSRLRRRLARIPGIRHLIRQPLTLPGIRTWPNGGSCIYSWLAMGRVHAYVMFNEPRSEIDPGLAFAEASGLTLFSVEANGRLIPYSFQAGQSAGRVPFFIAACSDDLARDIARLVRNGELS
ncbi:MAG: hypothetical protein Q7S63_00670 [bacterium]|nr:hypothetical protein [bacterium]